MAYNVSLVVSSLKMEVTEFMCHCFHVCNHSAPPENMCGKKPNTIFFLDRKD